MATNITIELAQEDRERFDVLIELLSMQQLDKEDAAKKEPAPAAAEPDAAPTAPAAEEEPQPQYTVDDVRALVQQLATPESGKKNDVKKIVNAYAPNVSGIPADKYPEVMQRLLALKEG